MAQEAEREKTVYQEDLEGGCVAVPSLRGLEMASLGRMRLGVTDGADVEVFSRRASWLDR